MTVPLIAASHWLGQAGGLSLAGKSTGGVGRRIGECLGAVAVCLLVTLILVEVFGWQPRRGWLVPFPIHREESVMNMVGATGFLLGFAALEELVYRGVLLRWIYWEARRWKHALGLAVLLSTIFFSIGHGFNPLKFTQTLVMGGCFAWVCLRHGLWAAAATHGVFNVAVSFWAKLG
jgi:membrane protease YdiL (CAAX protease family)